MQPVPFRSLSADVHQSLLDLAATDAGVVRIDVAGCDRLSPSFIAACQRVAERGVRVGLLHLNEVSRRALVVIDGPGVPEDLDGVPAAPVVHDHPYRVVVQADGALLITALSGICSHPQLGTRDSYGWLAGFALTTLTVDLALVDHINSVLVSWILQISQHASPVKPRLVHASRSIAVQMTRLRLDHLVDIIPD